MYYNHLKNGGQPQNSKTNAVASAQRFIDSLLNEGKRTYVESSVCKKCQLPTYYNEALYKRGQQFFFRHMFAMLFAKLNGLLAVLSIPTILNILVLTQKSSSDFTAYIRYLSTIFHMVIWYKEDLNPGSKLWGSIQEVNKKHTAASKKGSTYGLCRISQADMAFTQFGFMGFQVARPGMVGLHNVTEEEWKAFIHVWRVVGYLMGIEERFNICRESVEETKEICNLLIDRSFFPQVEKRDRTYLKMSRHLIHGLWTMNPILRYKVMMNYLYDLLKPVDDNNNQKILESKEHKKLFDMSLLLRFRFWIIGFVLTIVLKYSIFRIIFNWLEHLALWLMEVCPFLAYYSFGKANTIVKIKV
ncbi:uncharacterized protein LOC114334048 [Diabrotica virgifera virgifera]|uniref:ER-bound oxygenase mpaB/mpaB'/Rubber oxygenase catalytic domain-containing protein n=1 Tax=Diabrotica virgifera virgifera TaxID=50390 RepID=A0ABM5L7N7_DIAVI|nr:uncharacterized protein LOC114334048 [Diabrotica virgifera virgifera]XP_050518451.1 uncharacterized protein LOC114334048 [Diabrotica virgifera virgifera]